MPRRRQRRAAALVVRVTISRPKLSRVHRTPGEDDAHCALWRDVDARVRQMHRALNGVVLVVIGEFRALLLRRIVVAQLNLAQLRIEDAIPQHRLVSLVAVATHALLV